MYVYYVSFYYSFCACSGVVFVHCGTCSLVDNYFRYEQNRTPEVGSVVVAVVVVPEMSSVPIAVVVPVMGSVLVGIVALDELSMWL